MKKGPFPLPFHNGLSVFFSYELAFFGIFTPVRYFIFRSGESQWYTSEEVAYTLVTTAVIKNIYCLGVIINNECEKCLLSRCESIHHLLLNDNLLVKVRLFGV